MNSKVLNLHHYTVCFLQFSLRWRGTAQQGPCTRIAKLRLIETGWACGVTFASNVALLARNRVMGGVILLMNFLNQTKFNHEGIEF